MSKKKLCYGIDFGTTNSLLIAADEDQIYSPIQLDAKNIEPSILKSVFFFDINNAVYFGTDAIEQYILDAGQGRFIRSIKKFLPAASFNKTRLGSKWLGLEDIIARFLQELKKRADEHYGQDVTDVVLGRPARYSDDDKKDNLAKERMKRAAEIAGFKNIHFLEEPIAAAYSYFNDMEKEVNLLVVDLGGGTSDFTVMKLNTDQTTEVLSMGGVSIAGDIIDGEVMKDLIAPSFGSTIKYQMPMSHNKLTMPPTLKSKLASPAEITLMNQSDIMIFLEDVRKSTITKEAGEKLDRLFNLVADNQGFALFNKIEKLKMDVCTKKDGDLIFDHPGAEVDAHLNYDEFIDISGKKMHDIFNCLEKVLEKSNLTPSQIDQICLTGGTAKIPYIKTYLNDKFGEDKIKTYKNFHSVIEGLGHRAQEKCKAI